MSTLPFRGEEPNFQEQLQNFVVAASKFNIDRHSTSMTSKGPSENLKKMSWDNPVSPIDAKNSICFYLRPLPRIHTFHQYLEDLH